MIYKSCFDSFEIPYLDKPYRDVAYRGQIVVSETQGTVGDDQPFTFTVRLSVAPTHNQVVNFNIDNGAIAIDSLAESDINPIAENALTFTPLDYYKPRTIIVNKVNKTSDNATITLSSPADPNIAVQVANKTVAITIS